MCRLPLRDERFLTLAVVPAGAVTQSSAPRHITKPGCYEAGDLPGAGCLGYRCPKDRPARITVGPGAGARFRETT